MGGLSITRDLVQLMGRPDRLVGRGRGLDLQPRRSVASNPGARSGSSRSGVDKHDRPCLAWKQEIGGSNPPHAGHCPRSSADESGRLLNGGSGVQVTRGLQDGMVGRAARQRDANAPRPFGLRRFDPCTIRHAGRSSMAEPLPSKQKTRVRFSLPAPHRHVRLAASGRGHRPSNPDSAGSNPARGTIVLPPSW